MSIRAIVSILVVAWMFAAADQASAMGQSTRGQSATRAGGSAAGATGQTVGAGTGAQAIGSDAPSGAVTGQIGRSSDRMLQDVGAAGTGGTGGRGGLGGLGGLGGGRGLGGFGGLSPFGANPFGTNNSASAKPSIRTRLVNGIEPLANVSPGVITAGMAPRLISSAPVSRIVNGYSIVFVDGVATLSGVAKSAKDRRMAELVLKLEPGIDKIDNRIVVAP